MHTHGLRIFLVLILSWSLVRVGIYFIPGDPATLLAHESLMPISADEMRSMMSLDQPALNRIFSLPSGQSLVHRTSVNDLVYPALIRTIALTLLTFLLSSSIAILMLFVTFIKPKLAHPLSLMTTLTSSLPLMILGPLFIILFAVKFPIFEITQQIYLPAITLTLYFSGFWYRSIQNQVRLFLPQSAVSGARARGIPESQVFFRYLLIPLFGRISAYFGTQLGSILGGSVLVETLFQWPGLGLLTFHAVFERDYPVIETTLMISIFSSVLAQQMGYWIQKKLEVRS
jgi:peptide/nickel transport system permease protein